jgi:hypothetical protein
MHGSPLLWIPELYLGKQAQRSQTNSQRMGEKLVHSTPTRKERKNRATQESSATDRKRNGYRNTVESRKRSTTTSSTHLAQRRRTLAAEIQKPLDKSRVIQIPPSSTSKLNHEGKKIQSPPLPQIQGNNSTPLIKSKRRPFTTSIIYISNQTVKKQMQMLLTCLPISQV